MKSKYLSKIKKRLVISTLTMICILAQLGSSVVMAASNKDLVTIINEVGTETVVVIEEDELKTTVTVTGGSSGKRIDTTDFAYKSPGLNLTTHTTTKKDKKSTYSADGRYYYGGYTGTPYVTTKYLSEQHPQLKKDLEDMFGAKNLILEDRITGYSTTLWWVLGNPKSPVYKAVKDESMRLKLGEIGVKNKLQKQPDFASSHLVPLFTYYGIINTKDGLLDYTHNTNDYLTRQQAALMLGRFHHPESYMMDSLNGSSKSDGLYNAYVDHYSGQMMLRPGGKNGLTKEELEAPITKLEMLYMIMQSYFLSDVLAAQASKKTCIDIFNDITKSNVVTDSWVKKNNLLDQYGNLVDDNLSVRKELEQKRVNITDGIVEAAYDLGILKPDSKGNANLFKPLTKSQALRMLAETAFVVAEGRSVIYK